MGTEFALARVNLSLQPQIETVKKTTWFIFLLFLGVSCLDDPDCFRLTNNFIGVAFRVMGSGKLDTVALFGIESKGLRFPVADTALATGVELELNIFENQTEFTFIRPGQTNHLTLGYQLQTQFVSDDCGPRYLLSNLQMIESDFADSVRIVTKTPSRRGGRHVEIFRCPHPDSLGVSFRQLTFNPAQTTQSSRYVSPVFDKVLVDDAVEFHANKRAATVYLPVNQSSGEKSSSYAFHFKNNSGKDTLKITYRVTHVDRYKQCGVQAFVDTIRVLESTTFDSVRLTRDANDQFIDYLTDPKEPNIEIFRCPETNIAQLRFRKVVNTFERDSALVLKGITTNYNEVVYYADTTVRSVQLPLNPESDNTIFFLELEDGTVREVAFSYTRTTRRFFRKACGGSQMAFTELDTESTDVEITNPNIQFPPINNIEVLH